MTAENKPGNNLYEMLKIMRERYWYHTGSDDLSALKAFIHGYLQGLFQNQIPERSFPKYEWFSHWVKGRIYSELDSGYGWDKYIKSACLENGHEEIQLFFKLYDEYMKSEMMCSYQTLTIQKKIFRDLPHGFSWTRINDSTTELLMFELLPSTSAWCFYLDQYKNILHTTVAESKTILIEKIKTQYFAILDNDWINFDGKFFLRNLILNRSGNNY